MRRRMPPRRTPSNFFGRKSRETRMGCRGLFVSGSRTLQPDDRRIAQSPPVHLCPQFGCIFFDSIAVGEKMSGAAPPRFAIGLNFLANALVVTQQALVARRR